MDAIDNSSDWAATKEVMVVVKKDRIEARNKPKLSKFLLTRASLLMHPQLADKKLGKCSSSVAFDPLTTTSVCKDFIQALEECHLSTWARFTGGCNKYKDAMNVCLHEEVRFFNSLPIDLLNISYRV